MAVSNPTVFFNGRYEEALEFYHYDKLGAEIPVSTAFQGLTAGWRTTATASEWPRDKIMHATFRIGSSSHHGVDGVATLRPGVLGFRYR